MPRLRPAELAWTQFANISRQQYVCRTCRAHAARQIHTTRTLAAELGFLKRMRESLFGSKESTALAKKRDEEQKRLAAAQDGSEVMTDDRGKTYNVAAIVDSSTHPEYIPASNWDDLERMGGEEWIKQRLDQGEPYVGFMPGQRAELSDEQWMRVLRHVVGEISEPPVGVEQKITTANLRTEMESQSSSRQRLEEQESDRSELEDDVQEPPGDVRLAKLQNILDHSDTKQEASDLSWMAMRLADPLVKFAIVKRTMQLTGHRISDPSIAGANTLTDLYNAFKTKEAPKKLAQTSELRLLDENTPNVRVHSRRQTPIDKEKAVGRWKIIEDELIARGLPVTGSNWHDAKPRIGIER